MKPGSREKTDLRNFPNVTLRFPSRLVLQSFGKLLFRAFAQEEMQGRAGLRSIGSLAVRKGKVWARRFI
jgi:hypothetical protein